LSAYPETRAYLAELLCDAEVDHTSFSRPLRRCELSRCRGTCCHDGVFLNPDEATAIRSLVETERATFEALLPDLPDKVVVYGKTDSFSGPKTATVPYPMADKAENYPAHFPQHRCAFLDAESRCTLQMRSMSKGLHPWHDKPFTCWMHPISIIQRQGQPALLTLHNEATDPQQRKGYPGFHCHTHCGKTEPTGDPAHLVLSEELAELGRIGGRDFVGEIKDQPAPPPDRIKVTGGTR